MDLPDLRRAGVWLFGKRELRIWRTAFPPNAGELWRFVEDSVGVTSLERVRWWSASDTTLRAHEQQADGSSCRSSVGKGGVEICVLERLDMPYAANRLRVLAQHGIWTLPGSAASPPTSTPCVDVCIAPGVLVVEARVGQEYRTYGYTIPLALPDSVGQLLYYLQY